jgi:hypothetical protein
VHKEEKGWSYNGNVTNTWRICPVCTVLPYIEGISIISSDPPYDSELKVRYFGTQCYFYDTVIPSNEKIVINLSAVALKSGDYSGNMDIWPSGSNGEKNNAKQTSLITC